MPSKKKKEEVNIAPEEIIEPKTQEVEAPAKKTEKTPAKKEEKTPKYPIGSIVFVSKDADTDLEGFKLFPQYKKYTYTVEAYDAISGVYSLRRANLLIRLKEDLILSPSERGDSSMARMQF